MSDLKINIAKNFELLLQKKDGDKITVKDIVDACGISRQAFYYHFEDIQAVLEWNFENKLNEVLGKCDFSQEPRQAIALLLQEIWDEKRYMKRMKDSKNMDRLLKLLTDVIRQYLEELVNRNQERILLAMRDIKRLLDFYASGIAGYMIQRVEDTSFDYENYAIFLEKMIFGEIKLIKK